MSTDFTEEDIWFDNGEIRLAGSLLLPVVGGLYPAVVFIHGSGYSDRTKKWYRRVADHLLHHGIAVLLPDKRGSGQSGGDWRHADLYDLAEDTLAACAFLRERSEVDPGRLGLLGVSQGGWIAPMVAEQSDDIAFIIVVSGSAVIPARNLAHEVRHDIRRRGLPGTLARLVLPFSNLLVQLRWRRWRDVRRFDPIPLWERLSVPALIVNGAEDDNVPVAESVARLETAIQRRGDEAIKRASLP